jgi:hypothetical protein
MLHVSSDGGLAISGSIACSWMSERRRVLRLVISLSVRGSVPEIGLSERLSSLSEVRFDSSAGLRVPWVVRSPRLCQHYAVLTHAV